MSAEGNLKFSHTPHVPSRREDAATGSKNGKNVCAYCALPLKGHPVLLKTGGSVHVDCYFLLQKGSAKTRRQRT